MKKYVSRLSVAILIVLGGCAPLHQTQRQDYDGSPWATGPTLEKQLIALGISLGNCTKFIAYGNESSFTQNSQVVLGKGDIEFIWKNMLKTAEPYTYWEASGNLKLELYCGNERSPRATLDVNSTDRTDIEGVRGGYICRGLNSLLIQRLREKSNQRADFTR